MLPSDHVQRVRIYLSRDDISDGRPRYLALMDRLRNAGATGATALQGLAGFGPSQRISTTASERTDQHQPVVIEWLDRPDRITRLLPLLDELLGQSLVTIEEIPVYRAVLRDSGPFAADRTVGGTMRSPAPSSNVEATLSSALTLLIEHQIAVLPIVEADGSLAGLLSEQELAWRVGLRLPPALIRLLTPTERDALLSPLIGRMVREVMSAEPRSVSMETSLPQALTTMIEWGYAQIPVIDHKRHLVGLIGQDDVLRAAIEQSPPQDSSIRTTEPPTSVGLVMQTITPQLTLGQPLALALDHLLAAPGRQILISDGTGRLRGSIDLAGVLTRLTGEERATLIAGLQHPRPGPLQISHQQTLDSIVSTDLPILTPDQPITQAARRLIELGNDSMPVVDKDSRLLGIIACGGLIRALLQQSE